MAKKAAEGEEVVGYKQKHGRCKKCSRGSDVAMQDRKARPTRMSTINTLVVLGHNNVEMLDIAEK